MVTDPSAALSSAVFTAISALADGRVYYRVPDNAPLPFIYLGSDQIVTAYDRGDDFSDCFVTVHIYSDRLNTLHSLMASVRSALDRQLTVSGFGCYEWEMERSQVIPEDKEQYAQAVMSFRYLILESP